MIIKLLVITQLANIVLTYFQLDLGVQYIMVSLSFIPNIFIVMADHRNIDHKETYIRVLLFGLSIFVYTLQEPAQFQIFTAIYINLIYSLLENQNVLDLIMQGATYIYILIFTTQPTKTDITRSVVCCILLLIYFYPKIDKQIMNRSFTLPNSATNILKDIFTPQTKLQTFGLLILDPIDLSVLQTNDRMIQIERMLNQNMSYLIKCLKILQIDKEARQRLDLIKDNKVQFIWLIDLLKRIREKNNIQEIQILDVENEIFKEFLIKIYYTEDQFVLHFYQCVHRDNYLKRQYTQVIMSQIFKTLSHEIGTALNFILALAQSENDPQSINSNLKLIENTGKIMHYFVLDMVDFSDQMSKKFRLCIENVNLESLLQEVCDMFRATLSYKGLKIDYVNECARDLQFFSDPRRIKQILINLISNAQKFSFQGIIQVIVRRDNIKNIEFQVKDEGIGMSDQELEDLRKKLSNVDMQKQISKNTAGFGLGTYLANQIAKSLSKNRYQNELGLKIEQQIQGLKVSFCVDFYEINISKTISSTPSGMYFKNAYIDLRKSQLDNSQGSQQGKSLFRTRTKQNRQDTINARQYNPSTQSQGIQNQQSINSLLEHQNVKRENSLYIDQVLEKQATAKKNLLNQETLGFPRQQEVVFTVLKEEDGVAADPDYDDQQKRLNGISKSVAKKNKQNLSVQISDIKVEHPPSSNNYFDLEEKIKSQEQICDKCIKFLIVDDEQINILGLKLMLQSLGYQSDCAYNGKDALIKINENQLSIYSYQQEHCQYYIIFMDINMPIMDGFEATKKILTEYSEVDYQIVACTAFTDAETKEKCYQIGMVQFINKPVNKQELKKIIDYYLRY